MQTRGPVTRRPPRRRKPAPKPGPPTFQRAVVSRPGAITPRPSSRASRPTPAQVSAARTIGRSDAASGGRNQIKKAAAYKAKAPSYKRSVQTAYDTLSSDQKNRLLKTAKGREGRIVRELHAGRERNAAAQGVSGDRPYTDVDRALNKRFRGDVGKTPRFTSRAAYQAAVKEAALPAVSRAAYKAEQPSRFGGDVKAARAARKQREDPNLEKARKKGYLETDKAKLKAAGFAPPGLAEKIVSSPKYAIKYGIKPAVTDVTELAITTPSSLAKAAAETGAATVESVKKKSPTPLAKHVGKVAKETAEQYAYVATHPKVWAERPVTTALMFQPAVRVPGLAAGRVARVAGKQTLRRPDVELEGTALREQRIGSRDIVVRAVQSRRDKRAAKGANGKEPKPRRGLARGVPRVRVRAPRERQMLETTRGGARRSTVEQRVDEFRDFAQHIRNDHLKKAAKDARKEAKGKSKEERAAIFEQAREEAMEAADLEIRERFGREFGATERLSTSVADEQAAKAEREAAKAAKQEAKGAVSAAEATRAAALTEARVARAAGAGRSSPRLAELRAKRRAAVRHAEQTSRAAKADYESAVAAARTAEAAGPKSPQLRELQAEQRTALRELRNAEAAHADAMTEFGIARGRAQVLSRNVAGERGERAATARTVPAGTVQFRGGGHGVELGAQALRSQTRAVDQARARVKDLEGKIAAESRRVSGVPPAQADALLRALAEQPARVQQGREAREGVRAIEREIAGERKRISGIPPKQQDALLRAIADVEEAKGAHAATKETHKGAERAHKDLKKALANAELVDAAPRARLYDSKAEASRVATLQPFDAKPFKVGEKWAVLPEVAKKRLKAHKVVGTSPALGARELRTLSTSFRSTVLPLSMKWLFGQVSEAAFRTAVQHGFNPAAVVASLVREGKVYRELERMQEGLGDEMRARAVRGGQFGSTSISREFMGDENQRTLAEEFKDSYAEGAAKATTRAAAAPVIKQFRENVWHPYKHLIFNVVNGFFEEGARRTMTGREIARGPLMERRILTLTDKAIEEAAQGLRGTEAQVQLARSVDRAYGQYQRFPPHTRERLAHWTPFLPWYLNTVKFLFSVMPRDHPVITSLAASYSLATEDWRKEQGLSFHGGKRVPPWLLGTYKDAKGNHRDVGRYLPFSPGSPTEAAGALIFPQLLGAVDPLKTGRDWKGGVIKGGELGIVREALQSGVEAHVPLAATIGRATGVSEKLRGKEAKGSSVIENLGITQNPFGIKGGKQKAKVPKAKRKSGFGGGGGGGFGGGGFGGGF